jgi:hypothetical protein
LSLHSSIASVNGPPRAPFGAFKAPEFDFNAGPDPDPANRSAALVFCQNHDHRLILQGILLIVVVNCGQGEEGEPGHPPAHLGGPGQGGTHAGQ